MGWEGYLVVDGTEIINTSRTEAYARAAGLDWFTPAYENEALRILLGHDTYTTPTLDAAPWYDEDDPDSMEFFGAYPLAVTGLDDSSRVPATMEFTTDGGTPGRLRAAVKPFVYSVLLVGSTNKGVEYGNRWLRRAALGRACSSLRADDTTLGVTMEVLSVEPSLPVTIPGGIPLDGDTVFLDGGDAGGIPPDTEATPEEALRKFQRYFHNVKVTSGPVVDRKHSFGVDSDSCVGAAWMVQFTILAGDPHEYGSTQPILQGYMDPEVTDPWPPSVPDPGTADATWHDWTEVDCGVQIWQPIFDPLCTAMITPPAPPVIPLGCYNPPETWNRRKVSIPADNIPLWGDMIPVLTVYAPEELRNLRVRWYANADGDFDPDDNPCDFVGDWVLSYIPAGATMVIDSVSQQVRITTSLGTVRRADSLVFQNNSTPIQWPKLTCGYGYIMTLDLPDGEPDPVVDLAFVPKVAA